MTRVHDIGILSNLNAKLLLKTKLVVCKCYIITVTLPLKKTTTNCNVDITFSNLNLPTSSPLTANVRIGNGFSNTSSKFVHFKEGNLLKKKISGQYLYIT